MKTFREIECGDTLYVAILNKEESLKTSQLSYSTFDVVVTGLTTANRIGIPPIISVAVGRPSVMFDYLNITFDGIGEYSAVFGVNENDFDNDNAVFSTGCVITTEKESIPAAIKRLVETTIEQLGASIQENRYWLDSLEPEHRLYKQLLESIESK